MNLTTTAFVFVAGVGPAGGEWRGRWRRLRMRSVAGAAVDPERGRSPIYSVRSGSRPRVSRPERMWLTKLVVGLLALGLGLGLGGCSRSGPPSPTVSDAPVSAVVPQQPACAAGDSGDFWVPPGADGAAGAVLVLGSGPRGVVLAPQSDGDICQWINYGRMLAGQGYRVAMFNWAQPSETALLGATGRLRELGARRVVLVGASMGGAYVLGYAARLKPDGVVSLSGEASLDGLENDTLIRRYRGPLLLLGSEHDGYTPGDATRILAKNHPGPEKVIIVPGTAHGIDLLDYSDVEAAFETFLDHTLNP